MLLSTSVGVFLINDLYGKAQGTVGSATQQQVVWTANENRAGGGEEQASKTHASMASVSVPASRFPPWLRYGSQIKAFLPKLFSVIVLITAMET